MHTFIVILNCNKLKCMQHKLDSQKMCTYSLLFYQLMQTMCGIAKGEYYVQTDMGFKTTC